MIMSGKTEETLKILLRVIHLVVYLQKQNLVNGKKFNKV